MGFGKDVAQECMQLISNAGDTRLQRNSHLSLQDFELYPFYKLFTL
jgi:hypothetical protein